EACALHAARGLASGGNGCEGMIAHVPLEHMAPHDRETSARRRRERDAATFARVIGELDVGAEGAGAVERNIPVDRRARVRAGCALRLRGFEIALVDPTRMQRPRRIERNGFEAMRNALSIPMHR